MAYSTNGRADVSGPPILLGDFLPEQRVVVLNGNEYKAWVTTNRRYPRRIMVALDAASRRYRKVIEPLLADLPNEKDLLPGELEDLVAEREDAAEAQQSAYNSYVSECVSLLVQHLPESEADMIPLEDAERLLRTLGLFRPLESAPAEKEAGAEDSEAPLLIGDGSADDFAMSTQDTN
jgi:hypothetical protein